MNILRRLVPPALGIQPIGQLPKDRIQHATVGPLLDAGKDVLRIASQSELAVTLEPPFPRQIGNQSPQVPIVVQVPVLA